MARKPRVMFDGAIYHVTFRGNARGEIFADDRDRERLIERLAESAETAGVRVYLYCLMPNHVHLVVETPQGNLSRFMSSVLTGYTVYFNRRHGRVGHLMQGRYGAKVVQGDEYLLRLSRYVHLNPVWVSGWEKKPLKERVKRLRSYGWSSYPGYAGLAKPERWVDREPLLAQVGGGGTGAKREYRRYVESGLARTDEEFVERLRGSPVGIGSDAFVAKVTELYGGLSGRKVKEEDVALRRTVRNAPKEIVLRALEEEGIKAADLLRRRRDIAERGLAAHLLMKRAGLTQRDIAGLFGMKSGSSVSHQVSVLKRRLAAEPLLRERLANLEACVNRYFKG